jgi:hypothetical protein
LQYPLHIILALAIGLLAMAAPDTSMAQQPPQEQTEAEAAGGEPEADPSDAFFGDSHRQTLYDQSKLSVSTAVLYNLALPGLGNAYADQYFYAGIAFSLMVFTGVFVGYGLYTDQSQFLWMGAGTAAVTYSASILTSIQGVHDYNRKLRQGLKLDGAFSAGPYDAPAARTFGVSIRF